MNSSEVFLIIAGLNIAALLFVVTQIAPKEFLK